MSFLSSSIGLKEWRAECRRRGSWNPVTGVMQPRNRDGSWFEPFDPASAVDANGFVEATAWLSDFFVPHVPEIVQTYSTPVTP